MTRIVPVAIAFRHLHSLDWAEAEIRTRAAKLASYCADIESCRVLVEIPHRRHRHGNRFHVRLDLAVPGEVIAVSLAPDAHGLQQDLAEPAPKRERESEAERKDGRLVIRQAFDVARRRLQDYVQLRRHAVKAHTSRARRRRAPIGQEPVERIAV